MITLFATSSFAHLQYCAYAYIFRINILIVNYSITNRDIGYIIRDTAVDIKLRGMPSVTQSVTMAPAKRQKRHQPTIFIECETSTNRTVRPTSSGRSVSPLQIELPLPGVPHEFGTVNFTEAEQVLEAAREGPEAMCEPEMRAVLVHTLCEIWKRILRNPNTYTMTRQEFAVFNFFQGIPLDRERAEIARKARANYWTHQVGTWIPGKHRAFQQQQQ
ncbi:hypothetical protein F4804DRAFT_322574 [Jackrogersella minutella]|nr:hypothetical protein F4804DRAFT_322574 [Jackrogersella minutella]